jgi:hypothetical protein
VVLAAVAALAAPALADPPPSTDPTTGGKAMVALVDISNPGERPPRTVVVIDPGSDPGDGKGPRIAVANPPPDQTPGPSVTGRTVAATPTLSDKDPWPDPPPRSFDIAIPNPPVDPDPHPKSFGVDVPGGGTHDNGPRAAVAGPPPIVVEG